MFLAEVFEVKVHNKWKREQAEAVATAETGMFSFCLVRRFWQNFDDDC